MGRFLVLILMLVPQICLSLDWRDENGNPVSDEVVTQAWGDVIMEEAKKVARKMEPVYENLKTCLPIQNEYFQIFGTENGLCHFKYGGYDCLVPQKIAAELADLGLFGVREALNGNWSTRSSEAVNFQEILSDKAYCSYKMELMVVDENGNEIDGVIIEDIYD